MGWPLFVPLYQASHQGTAVEAVPRPYRLTTLSVATITRIDRQCFVNEGMKGAVMLSRSEASVPGATDSSGRGLQNDIDRPLANYQICIRHQVG